MEKMQVIKHPQWGTISIIIVDGKEMFKANECAAMLGYAHPKDAISRHCKGATFHRLPSKGGEQNVKLIPEGDLWRLIIRSKLPQANEIERWIMDEVLPSIRKTGCYNMDAQHERQLELPVDAYEYFDKTWNGVPVLSTADIAHLLGVTKHTLYYAFKTIRLTIGTDYMQLDGRELRLFKMQNPRVCRNCNHMTLFTRSGFRAICEALHVEIEPPKMLAEKPEPPTVCAIRPHDSMKSLMGYLQRETRKVQCFAELMLTLDTEQNLELYRKQLVRAMNMLNQYLIDVKTIRIAGHS